MKHIRTIIDKEWTEVFKNRMVIGMMAFMPLVFTALPLIMLSSFSTDSMAGFDAANAGVPAGFLAACEGMNAGECMQVYLVNQFLLLFLMLPLMIPLVIAAYSIVGEKATRSLEPLLATPISVTELLSGKALAAAIPGIIATYISFGIFVVGLFLLDLSDNVRAYILSPTWLLAVLVLGPIFAVIAVMIAIFISSRVNDPRAAEQISSVVVLPLMGVLVLQLTGVLVVNLSFMISTILFSALIAVGMVYLGSIFFQRETILTRWK